MPNIAKILKDEIQRLARKEVKAAVTALKKENVALKHMAADLKRRVVQLERASKQTLRQNAKAAEKPAQASDDEVGKARITAKMIKTVRTRLGLSQGEFATLIGVSRLSVYQWETKKGRLQFRGNTKAAIVAVRKLKKKEALKRLETASA